MVAHVQTAAAAGNNTSSVTTASMSTTTGNGLVATFVADTGKMQGITDSAANAWIPVVAQTAEDGSDFFHSYVPNCVSSASHTFTVTLTSPGFPTVSISEISGHISEGPLDASSQGLSGLGTSHTTPGATSTVPNAIVFGVAGNFDSTTWTLTDGSFTQRSNIPTGPTAAGIFTATKVVANVGTYSMAYTTSKNVLEPDEYRHATVIYKGMASGPTELPCRPFRFSYRYV